MQEKIIDEDNGLDQLAIVQLHQIEWPKSLNQQMSLELLEWIVSEDFSVSVLSTAANRRIHVAPKPKMRSKKAYIVVGGFISYLILLKAGWDKPIKCVLDSDGSSNDTQRFQDDLFLGLCGIKAGPVSNAAKAVLLRNIMDMGEAAKCTSGISLSSRHLNSSTDLLKSLTGYDSRAFKRADKGCIPSKPLNLLMSNLGLEKTEGCLRSIEKNDEAN